MSVDECRERQQDELAALSAIFGESVSIVEGEERAPLACSIRLNTSDDASHLAVLSVRLPALYPLAPPELSLSCPWAGAAALSRMKEALDTTARASCVEDGGAEVLTELVQQLETLLAEAAAAADAAQQAATGGPSKVGDETLHEAVIKIDHMNAPAAYQRLLSKWASSLGLGARCLVPASPTGNRLTNIYIYLSGGDDAIGSFLQRLRTELVDVDRAGRPCRERMSSVLCRRRRPAQSSTALPTGWAVKEYVDDHGLEAAFDVLGVLHVGVGSSRFGGTEVRTDDTIQAQK